MEQALLNIFSDRAREVIDGLPACIYYKNKDGIYFEVNEAAVTSMANNRYINSNDKNRIIGSTDFDLFSQDIANHFRANDLAVMRTKNELSFEEDAKLPNGKVLKQLSAKKPMLDTQGNIIGIAGISFNITLTLALTHTHSQSYSWRSSAKNLTKREQQCLDLYLRGLTSKETARLLGISFRTVEEHFINIKNKLDCNHKRNLLALYK